LGVSSSSRALTAHDARAGRYRPPCLSPALSLLEPHRHAALRAAQYADDRLPISGELAGKIPRLRIGQFEVDATAVHREVAKGLVDRRGHLAPEGLQVCADQRSPHRSVRVLRELEE